MLSERFEVYYLVRQQAQSFKAQSKRCTGSQFLLAVYIVDEEIRKLLSLFSTSNLTVKTNS